MHRKYISLKCTAHPQSPTLTIAIVTNINHHLMQSSCAKRMAKLRDFNGIFSLAPDTMQLHTERSSIQWLAIARVSIQFIYFIFRRWMPFGTLLPVREAMRSVCVCVCGDGVTVRKCFLNENIHFVYCANARFFLRTPEIDVMAFRCVALNSANMHYCTPPSAFSQRSR